MIYKDTPFPITLNPFAKICSSEHPRAAFSFIC
jgi:hypothetical protein